MRLTGCAGTTVIRTLRPGRGYEVNNMTTNTITHHERRKVILTVDTDHEAEEATVTMTDVTNDVIVSKMSIRMTAFQYDQMFVSHGAGLHYDTVLEQEE